MKKLGLRFGQKVLSLITAVLLTTAMLPASYAADGEKILLLEDNCETLREDVVYDKASVLDDKNLIEPMSKYMLQATDHGANAVYQVAEDITSFKVTSWSYQKNGKRPGDMEFFVSADGVEYSLITDVSKTPGREKIGPKGDRVTGNDLWYEYIWEAGNLPEGTKYLKVVFGNMKGMPKAAYWYIRVDNVELYGGEQKEVSSDIVTRIDVQANMGVAGGKRADANLSGWSVFNIYNGSDEREVYAKFNTAAAPASFAKVYLGLNACITGEGVKTKNLLVKPVEDITWDPAVITWNNKPQSGEVIGRDSIATIDGIMNDFEIDITPFFKSEIAKCGIGKLDATYSFAIATEHDNEYVSVTPDSLYLKFVEEDEAAVVSLDDLKGEAVKVSSLAHLENDIAVDAKAAVKRNILKTTETVTAVPVVALYDEDMLVSIDICNEITLPDKDAETEFAFNITAKAGMKDPSFKILFWNSVDEMLPVLQIRMLDIK